MSRLGMPGAQASARARCLGPNLTAYADRAMDAATLLRWDRHVVACVACRYAVAEERRVLESLRSPAAAAVPGDLRGMLLALAAEGGDQVPGHDRPGEGALVFGGSAGGPVRVADAARVLGIPGTGHQSGLGHRAPRRPAVPPVPVSPVRVVDRGTPAMHRSARRATVFAGLAAGATAAAAWSLAMTGAGVTSPSPSVSPGLVQRTRPATPGFANAAFTVPNLAGSALGTSNPAATGFRPGVGAQRSHWAESTP